MKETITEIRYQLALLYVVGVFFFMTFYYHNAYFDMSQAKANVVIKVSFVYLLVMGVLRLLSFITRENNEKKNIKERLDFIDISMLLFLGAVVISVLVSNKRYAALWGTEGFGAGAVLILLLGGVYFLLSRYLKFSNIIIGSVLISGYILFLIGITDGFGLDLMGWREHIVLEVNDPRDYIATIGHRDWMVGYLGLMLPFTAVCYLYEKKKWLQWVYLGYMFLGFINLYLTKSDGGLLVFGCAVPLVYMALENKEYWKKIWYIILAFVAASVAMQMIQVVLGAKVLDDAVMGWLLDYHIVYILLPVAVLAICLSDRIIELKLRKLWIALTVLVIIALAVLTIIFFNGEIGTSRGYIWMYAVDSFSQFDIIHKLFGWGVECFRNAIHLFVGDQIKTVWLMAIKNAHNEILQYLVTTGIFGMLAYMSIFVAVFIKAIKEKVSCISLAAAVSIWTYFCTELVNNPQALNYAIFFCMLAFVRSNNLVKNNN